jgi:glycosyltransferase involved in cell wall biosynthesis
MSIKILHLISNKTGLGGAERFLLDMSEEYDNKKFSVSYCTIFSEGDNIFANEIRNRNLNCLELKGSSLLNLPQTVRRLVGFMRRERFDIVHTQLLHASIVGQLAAQIARVPARVITRQYTNDCYHEGNKYLNKLDAYVARKATKVIAISNAVRNDLLEQGVYSNKIELIFNGIRLEPFDNENETSSLREKFPDKYLLAFVANLNQRKGHEYLLQAMAQLVAKYNDIHLFLIGEGILRKELEELTAELKLEEHVSFLGYQPDVPTLLKNIDLYVHASVLEPLGIAILEAMAARKCIVATDVGGIPEIVVPGKTGFLVPSKNPDELAKTIIKAINQNEKTKEMGRLGRQRVEDAFSINAIVKQYEKLYIDVMN